MGMDSSSAQQHHLQEMGSQTLENMLACTKPQQEKKPRPADQQPMKCPRCDSTNTKFCYYNNYSLSQPRYFCKSCRRYWTKGGTLRNVPVGGGCRKNKRSSSSSSSSSKRNQENPINSAISSPIPCLTHLSSSSYEDHSNELSLAIARLQKQTNNGQLGLDNFHDLSILGHHHHHSNMSHHGGDNHHHVLGNSLTPNGLFENPMGFHNMYYGMENGNVSGGHEMGMGFEELSVGATIGSTAVKQEFCNARDDNGESSSSRVLWGFPWHNVVNGDGNSMMNELVDTNRVTNWNGISSSNWHGLLNSPLM